MSLGLVMDNAGPLAPGQSLRALSKVQSGILGCQRHLRRRQTINAGLLQPAAFVDRIGV